MFYGLPLDLRDVARRQHGVLSTAQLTAAGLDRDALCSRISLGQWQRLYRGVYATFSGTPPRDAALWGAILWAGDGAMLSYRSAAEVAGLADSAGRAIHLTVSSERRVIQTPGLVLHRAARASQQLHPVRLPPQTRVEETVLDLASVARSLDDTVAWVTSALGRGLTTQARLSEAMSQRARMRWRGALAELLSPDAEGLHSILEYRYHYGVERPHGLPGGTRQARFRQGGRNAYRDRFYEVYLVVVELDGRASHPVEKRWDDIHRDNATSAVGILTLRYGWIDVTEYPCWVAAEVALALSTRGFVGARPCSPSCPVGQVTGRHRTPA